MGRRGVVSILAGRRVWANGTIAGAQSASIVGPVMAIPGSFGSAIAVLPNFDGDGRAKIAIGAQAARDYAGEVFIRDIPRSTDDVIPQSGARSLVGLGASPDTGDRLGAALANLGDWNGDTATDLLIGAPYGDGEQTDSGTAYIVDGRGPASNHSVSSLGDPGVHVLRGQHALDGFGTAVAAARCPSGRISAAIGAPHGTVRGVLEAGSVLQVRRTASGRATLRRVVTGTFVAQHMGSAVAVSGCGRRTLLAAGGPDGRTPGGRPAAGRVAIRRPALP
jgi:hypothetical protein